MSSESNEILQKEGVTPAQKIATVYIKLGNIVLFLGEIEVLMKLRELLVFKGGENINTIIKHLNSITKKEKCDVELEFLEEYNSDGNIAVMSYDKRKITFYVRDIFIEHVSLKTECSIQDYFEILLCHELGHFKDEEYLGNYEIIFDKQKNLSGLKHQIDINKFIDIITKLRIELEIKAYTLGRQIVSEHLLQVYDKKNSDSIRSYRKGFQIAKTNIIMQLNRNT